MLLNYTRTQDSEPSPKPAKLLDLREAIGALD
jgi:hypothetical protein